MANNPWSYEEIAIACALYLNPMGRSIDDVKMISGVTGRSNKAVYAKMDNLSSLDDEYLKTGKKGLYHRSKLDDIVWNDFKKDPMAMNQKVAGYLSDRGYESGTLSIDNSLDEELCMEGIDRMAVVKVRNNQGAFRRIVLKGARGKCCLTGMGERQLLVASHIKPWKESTGEERTDIHNALCLNRLHDALFDRFLMTVDEEMNVYYAPQLADHIGEEYYENAIARYDKIKIYKNNRPGSDYIEYHIRRFEEKNMVKIADL